MKITEKYLVGNIANFPLHVVQAMVYEQVLQGNKADPYIFANCANSSKSEGGFDWYETDKGDNFWAMVIEFKRFDLITKTQKPNGHIHAKLMKQYAKDARTSETPWDKWEFRVRDWSDNIGFQPCDKHPAWLIETEYRRKTNV